MSTTLSYGYKKPANGDRGSSFFPDLAANIQQVNDHNHDGVTSAALAITAVVATTQTISSGSWASQGSGTYKQTVTLPGTLTFDAVSMEFRLSTGDIIYPTIVKASSTTYDIYINDNSVDVKAIYTT